MKKCIPTTRSGDDVAAAISVTDSADVFVASTASGRQMRSSSSNKSRLASSSSTIASITRSQSARSATAVVVVRRAAAASRSSSVRCPFSTFRVRKCADALRRRVAELGASLRDRRPRIPLRLRPGRSPRPWPRARRHRCGARPRRRNVQECGCRLKPGTPKQLDEAGAIDAAAPNQPASPVRESRP